MSILFRVNLQGINPFYVKESEFKNWVYQRLLLRLILSDGEEIKTHNNQIGMMTLTIGPLLGCNLNMLDYCRTSVIVLDLKCG